MPAHWMGLTVGKRKDVEGPGHLYLRLGESDDKSGSQVVKTGMTRVIKRKGRTRIKLETDTFSFNAPSFFDYYIQQECLRILLQALASPELCRNWTEAINSREKMP